MLMGTVHGENSSPRSENAAYFTVQVPRGVRLLELAQKAASLYEKQEIGGKETIANFRILEISP